MKFSKIFTTPGTCRAFGAFVLAPILLKAIVFFIDRGNGDSEKYIDDYRKNLKNIKRTVILYLYI